MLDNEARIEKLKKDIEDTIRNTAMIEENCLLFNQEIETSDKNTKNLLSSYNINNFEVSKINRDHNLLTKEIDLLQPQAEKLIKDCNKEIPYRRLRNTACNKCHSKIKEELREEIINIIQNRRSQSLMPSVISRDNKNNPFITAPTANTCSTCVIV